MPLEDEVVKRHVLEMTVLRVSPVAQLEVLTAAGLVNAPLCPPRRLCGNKQSRVGEDPWEPPLNWVDVKDLQRNCGLCVTEKPMSP